MSRRQSGLATTLGASILLERTWEKLGNAYYGVCFSPELIESWGTSENDLGLLRPHNLDRLTMLDWQYDVPEERLVH